ncbi:MAG TPA: DegT/DnrJ/EryC1/StrS family aminotransferase, partial [Gemmatimonadales bacterium]|nr:DegT/DnrJ/EryC1/StrS family aminotransferase [Gemmatimonadales bacterium]
EREFAAAIGAPHACAVSSCTTALHLALVAAGVGPGDEVVTVSHSFIATANAVRYCGALPVFVDVELDTFNIDPALVDAAITPRTKALLVVHQLGMPCDLVSLLAAARRHGVPVIEDAACAIGSEIRWQGEWQRIGRPHGDMACFSFHPRKLLSTGDGGMVVTASADTDARLRRLRQHGMSVSDAARHASAQVVFETYPALGFNYRLTDIQAAIGREQLARLDGLVARRRELAARYAVALAGMPGVVAPREPEWARTNWQTYAVRLEAADQRQVMQRMLDDGVSTRRGVMNAHREGAYPAGAWRASGPLTRSERAQDSVVMLPLYHDMTAEDQDRVIGSRTRAVLGP